MRVFLLFDISGGELLLVVLFVLMFFGAKGIPDIARTMGRAMRQLRDASSEVQREINRGATDVRKGFEEQKRALIEEPKSSVAQVPSASPPPDPPPPVEPPAPQA